MSFAIEDQSWFGAAMVAIGRYVLSLEKMEVVRIRRVVITFQYLIGPPLM